MSELHEALSTAYDQIESASEPAPATPEPVVEAPPDPAPLDGASAADRPRDESGRFVKTEEVGKEKPKAVEIGKPAAAPEGAEKAGASKTAAVGPGKGDATAPVAAPPEPASVKPPQAWSPAAREAFANAPPEVQREVDKREREISRALNETTQARQIAQAVQQRVQTYAPIASANNMDPMQFMDVGAQSMAAIYAGDPQAAAGVLANAIAILDRRSGGKAIDLVNEAMQNPQAAQPQRQVPNADPRVEVRRILEEERAQAQARDFLANPPEFWDTVQPDVIQLIELDRARGGNMTPQQAYERAVKYNDEVQGVLSQRKASEDAKKKAEEVARARTAAGSVRTQPAAAPPPAPSEDRRSVLENWEGWNKAS